MSDNIPFEIQSEIMRRLPIKPLIQFRSVSKAWKSLIDSSEFIANYHVRETQPSQHHLLVSYTDNNNNNNSVENYVSIADNDTFPRHVFPLTAPGSVKPLIEPTKVSSQGLLCFCAYEYDSEYRKAVIWNPTIRKSVYVVVPNDIQIDSSYETVFGFGVCPNTCDPKLVKVVFKRSLAGSGTIVEVFSLGVGAWRRLDVNLPRKSIAFTENNVAIDRFIYWHAYQQIDSLDAGSHWSDLVVSFDMMSEEFMEIRLPDCLALDLESSNFILSKMGESLVVVQIKIEAGKEIYSVWEMEDGVPKSFKKLFTIKTPHEVKNVLGFTKSGEAIIEMGNDVEKDALFVYEPNSENTTHIGITGKPYSCSVNSYMETLLLLDH